MAGCPLKPPAPAEVLGQRLPSYRTVRPPSMHSSEALLPMGGKKIQIRTFPLRRGVVLIEQFPPPARGQKSTIRIPSPWGE